jgi:cytochrome c553
MSSSVATLIARSAPARNACPAGMARRLDDSLARVIRWVTDHDYKGFEPADGNASLLYPLTGGRIAPMRVLQQVVLRAPFNIRPFLGVRPHESAIGRGYMAWAYASIFRRTGSTAAREQARACLTWLAANRARRYDDFCWGDPYEYATRSGRRPLGEPILIWTALIGLVFLEAFDLWGDARHLSIAESIGRWMLKLPVEETRTGVCLSYVTFRQSSIHNANVMGAAFLARLATATGHSRAQGVARAAMTYTCACQRPDGAWFYAEEPKYHWIDNFHTGYNLSALQIYRDASRDHTFDAHLAKGLRYFKGAFFEADGTPKYFHDRAQPIDIQCASQAIETLVALSAGDPDSLTLALKVADWTIANLQDRDGHFCYRDLGWTKVRTPMLHWGQATMAKALAMALEKVGDDA